MSRLLEAIQLQCDAADGLTRACARQGAIVNAENIHPLAGALKRSFRASLLTPKDMLDTLRKAK